MDNDERRLEGVDGYLAELPPDTRNALKKLRDAITEAAPEAEEAIKYHIPTYSYKGWLVHFRAGEKYCSFITGSAKVIKSLRKNLGGFDISGTTIHFTPEKPLPKTLIRKIVTARMEENEKKTTPKKM